MNAEMTKTLVITEVSSKQAYIFSSNKLRENIRRSEEIAYVTGNRAPVELAGAYYSEPENFVYSGGGHAVYQFDSGDAATAFVRTFTLAVKEKYPEIELFAACWDKDWYEEHPEYQIKNGAGKAKTFAELTPGEILGELSRKLERKKSFRAAAFHRVSFGIEDLGPDYRPISKSMPVSAGDTGFGIDKYSFIRDNNIFSKADDSNFIAVVTIDGNAMGKRVAEIYDSNTGSWDGCIETLRRFSEGTDRIFRETFCQMCDGLVSKYGDTAFSGNEILLRPVILAGDDVCFITKGNFGLFCAESFLKLLSEKDIPCAENIKFSACAGVAVVHSKFPFHKAYDISEELLGNAKRFGSSISIGGEISAMDWHIEYGQLKDSVSEIREDYLTEDGIITGIPTHLELRPVAVTAPNKFNEAVRKATLGFRTPDFIFALADSLRNEGTIPRSKLKGLRGALKQGETESRFYLKNRKIEKAVGDAVAAAHGTGNAPAGVFADIAGEKRSLIFDALELSEEKVFAGRGQNND